eukprot:scaffold260021_cov23-Tisochrysis_lutea.AAC.1
MWVCVPCAHVKAKCPTLQCPPCSCTTCRLSARASFTPTHTGCVQADHHLRAFPASGLLFHQRGEGAQERRACLDGWKSMHAPNIMHRQGETKGEQRAASTRKAGHKGAQQSIMESCPTGGHTTEG